MAIWTTCISVVGTVLVVVVGWYMNERSKRADGDYQRREDRYAQLLRCVRAFHVNSLEPEKQIDFLDELNQCWLYCPDNVILKANSFVMAMDVGSAATGDDVKQALGELLIAIRKDLLGRRPVRTTRLQAGDFVHAGITRTIG